MPGTPDARLAQREEKESVEKALEGYKEAGRINPSIPAGTDAAVEARKALPKKDDSKPADSKPPK